ncbi:MAG TPA: hypothetical protein DCL54_09075 [Alphaproteobacteria bacterium]|nr:hypothetical protein [Alphaproteobacteria bacterium]HAJ46716.1 hypothetical protein [Alphaproteobacteria bacterium]
METVNGYVCHNCSDVALAKRHIDPAHPKDAQGEPKNPVDKIRETLKTERQEAVTYGGSLAQVAAPADALSVRPVDPSQAPDRVFGRIGERLDLRA